MMTGGPIKLKATIFIAVLVPLLVDTTEAADVPDASGHDAYGAAMLMRCAVCTHLVAHLETELQGWRPLKVTESTVRNLVDGVCATDHSATTLRRSLSKDAFLLYDKENHNYILQNNSIDDPSSPYDIERFIKMPSEFMVEAVTEACNAILDNHHKEFATFFYREFKRKSSSEERISSPENQLCELSCRHSKATSKKRKRRRKHGRRHGALHLHEEL
mmetsp:Transcript_16110/g.22608  ORF Transcript_16110/g.22608 Transcript_16110/m.22608 type:complete len:217 (-) Transcript_16110:131-781(-)